MPPVAFKWGLGDSSKLPTSLQQGATFESTQSRGHCPSLGHSHRLYHPVSHGNATVANPATFAHYAPRSYHCGDGNPIPNRNGEAHCYTHFHRRENTAPNPDAPAYSY